MGYRVSEYQSSDKPIMATSRVTKLAGWMNHMTRPRKVAVRPRFQDCCFDIGCPLLVGAHTVAEEWAECALYTLGPAE